MRQVTVVYKTLPSYRVEFFDQLRNSLESHDVELRLLYGNPGQTEALKGDARTLPWATYVENRYFHLRNRTLIWQPVGADIAGSDLVIVEQASKLLLNYWLLARYLARPQRRIALWGHGANLQTHTASRLSEAMKRQYSKLPHWWFGYTEATKARVAGLGYPPERITVVQNSIDTRALSNQIDAVAEMERQSYMSQYGAVAGHTAVFLGSLYEDKRLEYLIDAASKAWERDPRFVLLIGGDGPSRSEVERAVAERPYVCFLGRVDGADRAKLLAAADVMLMPGLVGLAILDAFAGLAPMITLDHNYHSPEIDYMIDGVNGLVLPQTTTPAQYAEVVVELLRDSARLAELRHGCESARSIYTVESMVERFTTGVLLALES